MLPATWALIEVVRRDILMERSNQAAPAEQDSQQAVRKNVPPLGDWYLLPTVDRLILRPVFSFVENGSIWDVA